MTYQGFIFTPRTEYAEDYGDNLTQAFLNFRNPFTTDLGVYRRENGLTSWREVYESIQKEGYDGVMVSEGINNAEEEFIALQPAQIKSATGNVGTFSQSPDIRFQADEQYEIATGAAIESTEIPKKSVLAYRFGYINPDGTVSSVKVDESKSTRQYFKMGTWYDAEVRKSDMAVIPGFHFAYFAVSSAAL